MSSRCPARPLEDRDRGESLIELLMALAILGIGVVTLLGGMVTAVTGSGLRQQQAQAHAELRSWAERVNKRGFGTQPLWFEITVPTLPSGWSAPYDVECGSLNSSTNTFSFSATSNDLPLCSGEVQRLRLRITAPDGSWPGADEQLDVVVRKP